MKLDFNYDGKTKLKDWWGKIKANFQTVQDEFNEHRENTTLDHPDKSVKQQHIADYAVGQTQLQQYAVSSAKIYPGAVKTTHLADGNVTKVKLSEDVQQQLDKVTEVQEALTQEISDRQAADTLLQQNIDKEISDRQSEDNIIRGDITELQNTVESFGKPPSKLSEFRVGSETLPLELYSFPVNKGDKLYIINDVGDKSYLQSTTSDLIWNLSEPILKGKTYIFDFIEIPHDISPEDPTRNDGLINITSVDAEDMAEDISTLKTQVSQNSTDLIQESEERTQADSLLHSLLTKARIYDYLTTGTWVGSQFVDLPVGTEFVILNSSYDPIYPNEEITYTKFYVNDERAYTLSASIEPNKAYKCKIISQVDVSIDGHDGEIEVIGEFTDSDAYNEINNKLEIISAPINHRNIFRGKNLGSTVTEAQKTAIQSGTFDDLFVGDYWEIDGINWRIVDMDYWMNVGLENPGIIKHHLVIMPDKALYDYQMNDKDTNEGGYVGSLMYKTGLNQAKSTINNIFGDMILEHEEYFVNKVTDGKPSGTLWVTNATIDLPNEFMIFGANVSANTQIDVISVNQLSLFRMAPQFVNDRWGFWLRDVVVSPLGYNSFLYVSGNGLVSSRSSISTDELGVRPVFAIG